MKDEGKERDCFCISFFGLIFHLSTVLSFFIIHLLSFVSSLILPLHGTNKTLSIA